MPGASFYKSGSGNDCAQLCKLMFFDVTLDFSHNIGVS